MKYRIMQEWLLENKSLKVQYDSDDPETIYVLDNDDPPTDILDFTIEDAQEFVVALSQAINAAGKITHNPKKETPRR